MDDIKKLLDHLDQLPGIIERSKAAGHRVTVFQVLHPLSLEVGIDYKTLLDVFTALENLRFLEVEFGSSEQAVIRIEAAVDQALAQRIAAKRPELLRAMGVYLDENPILVSFKAQRLSYLHERIYRDAEILTDVRPVFDDPGGKILECIISHSLVITHSTAGRQERFHLTLDAEDVLKLRKACDRAIIKAQTLKNTLGRNADWNIHMLRDETDGA